MKLFLAVFFVLLLATCDTPVEPQIPDAQLQTIYGSGLTCADCANAIQAMIDAAYQPPSWCHGGLPDPECMEHNAATADVAGQFSTCVYMMGQGLVGGYTYTADNHVCIVGTGGGGGFSIQPGEFIEATGGYEGLSDVANEYIRGVYGK